MASNSGRDEALQSPALSPGSRRVGVVLWCSFLAAGLATMVFFGLIDPDALSGGEPPEWWTSRLRVYGIGFFFFWVIAAVASGLTLYMACTDRNR